MEASVAEVQVDGGSNPPAQESSPHVCLDPWNTLPGLHGHSCRLWTRRHREVDNRNQLWGPT